MSGTIRSSAAKHMVVPAPGCSSRAMACCAPGGYSVTGTFLLAENASPSAWCTQMSCACGDRREASSFVAFGFVVNRPMKSPETMRGEVSPVAEGNRTKLYPAVDFRPVAISAPCLRTHGLVFIGWLNAVVSAPCEPPGTAEPLRISAAHSSQALVTSGEFHDSVPASQSL